MTESAKPTSRYRNFGIAMPHDRVPVFEARLQALGMKTLGDLATAFCLADGMVEALTPVIASYNTKLAGRKSAADKRKEAVELLKSLDSSALDELLAKYKAQTEVRTPE